MKGGRQMQISNDLNNCTNLHVVSVISSFDCNGHILPLYIRINGESLKIHKSVLTHDSMQTNCRKTTHTPHSST